MSAYNVRAVPWAEGWELHIDGVGVTQVRNLNKAVDQVRDYIETVTDKRVAATDIDVRPDLGGLETEIERVRAAVTAAETARSNAARELRTVARALRTSKHLSVRDSATVLGVSPGRVSQLIK